MVAESAGVRSPSRRTSASSSAGLRSRSGRTASSMMASNSPWSDRWCRSARCRRRLTTSSGAFLIERLIGMVPNLLRFGTLIPHGSPSGHTADQLEGYGVDIVLIIVGRGPPVPYISCHSPTSADLRKTYRNQGLRPDPGEKSALDAVAVIRPWFVGQNGGTGIIPDPSDQNPYGPDSGAVFTPSQTLPHQGGGLFRTLPPPRWGKAGVGVRRRIRSPHPDLVLGGRRVRSPG
jgi:hypothetical protein